MREYVCGVWLGGSGGHTYGVCVRACASERVRACVRARVSEEWVMSACVPASVGGLTCELMGARVMREWASEPLTGPLVQPARCLGKAPVVTCMRLRQQPHQHRSESFHCVCHCS